MRLFPLFLTILLCFSAQTHWAQNLGIGTTDPKAALEVFSTESGILLPRLTSIQRDNITVSADIDGLIIYNTDLDRLEYYDHGEGWKAVAAGNGSGSGYWLGSGNDIYNDNSGNVGIGTSSPEEKLEVNGNIRLGNKDELQLGLADILIKGDNGDLEISTTDAVKIYGETLEIYAGNSRYVSFENSNRRVGINTQNPSASLHIKKSGADSPLRIESISSSNAYNTVLTLSNQGYVYKRSGANFSSDIRFKTDIRSIPQPLDRLLELRGVTYYFRFAEFPQMDWPVQQQMGVIAQEVEQIFPDLVSTDADGYKAVNYLAITALLIESVKELHAEKASLETEVATIKSQLEELESRLARLEKKNRDQP